MTATRDNARAVLRDSLTRRYPTWTVAAAIRDLGVGERLPDARRAELNGLAGHADVMGASYWMDDDFDRVTPVPAERYETMRALFPGMGTFPMPRGGDLELGVVARGYSLLCLDLMRFALPQDPSDLAEHVGALLASTRLNGAARKRLRFLRRMAQRADRMDEQTRLRHAQMQAKSRLAYDVNPDRLGDAALAFVAYLASRANRRSVFQVGEQSRAQDILSDALLDLIPGEGRGAGAQWAEVAKVLPTPRALALVTPDALGALTARFHSEMAVAARELKALWPQIPERNRDVMVVSKGVDSSRWNAYAGALNKMRQAWLNCMLAAGLDRTFGGYLPGKAPRLMAADVLWMYRGAGQDVHPDTRMFAALPKAWDVVNGDERLGLPQIDAVARTLGVDAQAEGWTGPRKAEERERPSIEPALVNGVVVSSPELARELKRAGVFSGKGVKGDVPEFERGMAVGPRGQAAPTAEPAYRPANRG